MEARSLALGLAIGLLVAAAVWLFSQQHIGLLEEGLSKAQEQLAGCRQALEAARANISALEKGLLACNLTKQRLEEDLREALQAAEELRASYEELHLQPCEHFSLHPLCVERVPFVRLC